MNTLRSWFDMVKNTKLQQNCMELDKRTKLKIVKVEIKLKEMKLEGFN